MVQYLHRIRDHLKEGSPNRQLNQILSVGRDGVGTKVSVIYEHTWEFQLCCQH